MPKNEILKTLFYKDYDELDKWIKIISNNKYYLPNFQKANIIDKEVCLSQSAHIVLLKALSFSNKRRKNGRDLRIIKALEHDNLVEVCSTIVSSVRSYWQDHGFFKKI